MELFHYTYRDAAESILREGIRTSRRPFPIDGHGEDIDAVSLTTSKSSDGHGYSNGECLIGKRLAIFKEAERQYANAEAVQFKDKTEVRLTIHIDDRNPKLVSWTQYCLRLNASMDFKGAAELSALFSPCCQAFTFDEQILVLKKVSEGALTFQGHSWWFYEGQVPKEWIIKVEDKIRPPGTREANSQLCLPHLAKPRFGLEWSGIERQNHFAQVGSPS